MTRALVIVGLQARIQEQEARLNRYKELETRLAKLEKNSAWNLLIGESQKLKLTPEQFLKLIITDYLKTKDK